MISSVSHLTIGSEARVRRKPLAGDPCLALLATAKRPRNRRPCSTAVVISLKILRRTSCFVQYTRDPIMMKAGIGSREIGEEDTTVTWHAGTLGEGKRLSVRFSESFADLWKLANNLGRASLSASVTATGINLTALFKQPPDRSACTARTVPATGRTKSRSHAHPPSCLSCQCTCCRCSVDVVSAVPLS